MLFWSASWNSKTDQLWFDIIDNISYSLLEVYCFCDKKTSQTENGGTVALEMNSYLVW